MGAATPIRDALLSGDRRALLAAMAERVAADLDSPTTSARDLAALTKRLDDFAKELAELDSAGKGDDVGDAVDTPDEQWSTA